MVVYRGWWDGGMRCSYLMVRELQFSKMKGVLEMDGSESCATV